MLCALGEMQFFLSKGRSLEWLELIGLGGLMINLVWSAVACGFLALGSIRKERRDGTAEELVMSGSALALLYRAKLATVLFTSLAGWLVVYSVLYASHRIVIAAYPTTRYEFMFIIQVFAFISLLLIPIAILSSWIAASVKNRLGGLVLYVALVLLGFLLIDIAMTVANSMLLSETDFLPARMVKQPTWKRMAVLPLAGALMAPLYYVLHRSARLRFARALASE